MSNKDVYILLTDTGTLFTKTIKLYTRKQYNHASIAFDEDLTKLYSFGRKKPRNPFVGGFVREDIKSELFRHATGVVYRLTVNGPVFYKMQQIIEKMNTQKESYRYNFLGLFAVMLNIQIERDNAFFCSEFVASVLKQSGGVNFDFPLSLITPHDLQKIDKLELVYQGTMSGYKSESKKQYRITSFDFPEAIITA